MASAIYPKGKEAILGDQVSLSTDTIKAVLVDTGAYTYSAAHQFLTDLTGTVGTAQTLASKTFTSGVFDAADITVPSVTGASVEAVVIYQDTGSGATSRLISFSDGISVTPNGGGISVTWDNGASKIFAL